jgi:ubiquinone/menaquinone biosynthesis C-methylase UbiE
MHELDGELEGGYAMAVLRDPEQVETRAINELIDFAGADVLEVGCGDGRLTWRYAEGTRSVLALDPDAAAIEQARASLASLPEPWCHMVTFQAADITSMELPPEAFDFVVLAWSL